MADIGLDDVDCPFTKQIDVLVTSIQTFARCHGDAQMSNCSPYLDESLRVLGRHRFLKPAGPKWGQTMTHIDRRMGGKTAVHLDKYLEIGPDRITNSANDLDRSAFFRLGHFVRTGTEWIDLKCLVPH